MKQALFSRDFTLVVIGQIVSLFGNATVRFALPLYLLSQTGSAALYGGVTACAFLPMILLSPVGGIVADRVNKGRMMVLLDFITALLLLGFTLLLRGEWLIPLVTVTLMLLYGIAGAYQPAVQASIPALVPPERMVEANSVVNVISSLAALAGPALGGIVYSAYGLKPVLWVCVVCFLLSAGMELWIQIPHQKRPREPLWAMVRGDFQESLHLIWREKPALGQVLLVLCALNLFLSAMLMVGLPYMITEVLPLEDSLADRLYGFAQGAMAAGGLVGGILAGVLAQRLTLDKAGRLLTACALLVFPMGLGCGFLPSGLVNDGILTAGCFGIMVCATLLTVQLMALIQRETPQDCMGKVISVVLTVAMCAQPLGAALYGFLFQQCQGFEFVVILFAGCASLVIARFARTALQRLTAGETKA